MTTLTIPVPVDVLRELLDDGCKHFTITGDICGVCHVKYSEKHHITCPIPALREAVEEVEKR